MQNDFERAQEEYFRLRGQFATGHLSAAQFDAALRELTVRDAAGRYWMLGANSGQWYYFDGDLWVAGQPPVSPPQAARAVEPLPIIEGEMRSAPSGRGAAIGFMVIAVILLCTAAFAIAFVMQSSNLLVSAGAFTSATRGAPLGAASATRAAVVAGTATATSTPRPPTAGPPDGIFEFKPTETPLPGLHIPTITPPVSLTPTEGQASDPPADVTPKAPPTAFANPSLPPGVYVSALTVSPNPGTRKEPVTFTATFHNSTGKTVYYRWRVVVLDPEKQGRNKDWGESPLAELAVAAGESAHAITYTPVTDRGGCITLQAQPAWRRDDNARIFFPDLVGGIVATGFTVC